MELFFIPYLKPLHFFPNQESIKRIHKKMKWSATYCEKLAKNYIPKYLFQLNLIETFSNMLNKYSVKKLSDLLQSRIYKSWKKNQVRRVFETKNKSKIFLLITWLESLSSYLFSYRWEVLKEAKQNYVTYIKSILYCNHACYYI